MRELAGPGPARGARAGAPARRVRGGGRGALVAAAAVAVVASNVAALRGYRSMRRHLALPWARLLADLDDPAATAGPGDPAWHRAHLARRRAGPPPRDGPRDVVHAVIIATWTESRHVLEPTVHAVRAAAYDPAQVILVLAYEARGGPEAEAGRSASSTTTAATSAT